MSERDDDDRTILVSNISSSVTSTHLRDLFSAVGRIVELNFVSSKGECWIEYAKNEGAKAAGYLAGTELGDRAIKVTLKSALPPPPTEEERAAAEKAGIAAPLNPLLNLTNSTSILPTPSAPSPTNAAFAAFTAAHALPSSSSSFSSSSSSEPFTSRTLYVGNLGPEASDVLLKEYFRPLGNVVATRFSGDANSTRYAFVEFETQASADAGLMWDQRQMLDRTLKIGKAQNSITKFNNAGPTPSIPFTTPAAALPPVKPQLQEILAKGTIDAAKVQTAMEKVRAAQAAIAHRLAIGAPPPPAIPMPIAMPTNVLPVIPQFAAPLLPFPVASPVVAPVPTTQAVQEEKKEAPSHSSSSRRRSRSRSRSPRPDYAERQRLKRHRYENRDRERFTGIQESDRWGADRRSRERSRERSRDRSRSRDRYRRHRDRSRDRSRSGSRDRSYRRSRSRSRSPRRQRDYDRRRRRDHDTAKKTGPPASGVPLVYDGFNWTPKLPDVPPTAVPPPAP
jgi:RNA recognition motif-containing protein